MRKKIIVFLLILVCSFLLVGCRQGENIAEYTLNLGDVMSENHPHSKAFYYFSNRVSELTKGKVKINVFINSTLGNQADLTEGLKLGTVHISKSMATLLSAYNPEIQIFDLPYLFQNKEHFFEVIDGEIGKHFLEKGLEKEDLIGLGYFYAGERSMYTRKPIHSIDDLKGLKIRVPESPIYLDMLKSMNASGVTMGVGELYTSLQTGVVDGAENAPIFYETLKHYEPAPYFTYTNHVIAPDIVIMKKSFFESMPEKYQQAIRQAAVEMCQYERKEWERQEQTVVEKLKKKNVVFEKVDVDSFRRATQPVREKYKDIVGVNRIQEIEKIGEKYK